MSTNVITNQKDTVTIADGLINTWKAKFDVQPDYTFEFEVKDGDLLLNGEPVCPADLIDAEKSFCDVEYIEFVLTTGDSAVIDIIWSSDGDISTHIRLIPSGFKPQYID